MSFREPTSECMMSPVVKSFPFELRTESRSMSRFAGKRVHFIGIGGCGMSGLASMLLDGGAIVSGSEPKPNPQTFELTARGAKISRDQLGELLSKQVDLVVRTAAVPDSNPEFQAAIALGINSIKYAEMLGLVMAERHGIAVSGTHGKSTTTAMISHALLSCGADPSFVVGGTVPQLGGGSRSGKSPFFVAEACEFDRSFHHLPPKLTIITNIEEDHLDCYKDLADIVDSFHTFASKVPLDGKIIALGTDPNVRKALKGIGTTIEYCAAHAGAERSDAPDVAWILQSTGTAHGCPTGEVLYDSQRIATLKLSIPGAHNLMNATMALAACVSCGLDPQLAADAIGKFKGVDRRMTQMGTVNGATVVDDYGHHPTEIRATLRALRERYQPGRLFCVFQPHQHSRTRFLLKDFAASFSDATESIIPDIYFVRDSESEKTLVNAEDLVAEIARNGQQARHMPEFATIVSYLRRQAMPGDLIVTMGAGNVWEIGRDLVGN